MLKKHKPKGLTPADFLQRLPPCGRYAGYTKTRWFIRLALTLSACCITPTHADTVYRCGEAYSTSSQCANGVATEVNPSSALHTTGPDKGNVATHDLRDAQVLEKQRLQAEQQANQAAPIRLSTPSEPSATPNPNRVTHNEQNANKGNRREKGKGKHARKPNSPYFTAVDPTAAPKKKNTAKAVPATSTSSP
jgi:hypothetical protein